MNAVVQPETKRQAAARRERMRAAVASLQEYMRTYHLQAEYQDYTDKTFIDDVLYGIGVALDREQYRMADGFDKFKALLRAHLDEAKEGPAT